MKNKFYLVGMAALIAVITFIAGFTGLEPQQRESSSRFEKEIASIESFIKSDLESLNIPAISIAFYKDDFFWSKGFGYANLEHQVKATSKTRYRLASVNKPMTAMPSLAWPLRAN